MTKLKLFITGAACLFLSQTYAQEDITVQTTKSKFLDHRVGVQANELIRQVFNFNSNANNALNNPYLLTFSVTHAKSGLGLRLGVGPEFNTFKTNDGITKTENNINKVNARIGLEKVFKLSERWSAGAGADFIYATDRSIVKTSVNTFDSTKTDLSTNVKSSGYGGMGWLRYHITPHVHIGTEASFYYRTGDEQQTITITRKTSNSVGKPVMTTTTDKTDNKIKEGLFRLPMVFYLVVMF